MPRPSHSKKDLTAAGEFRENLAATDPEAVHVVIHDQADFHLRDGDPRLPKRIRIMYPPPYNPEHNSCKQAWDMVKDGIGNRVFATVEDLREAVLQVLKRFRTDAAALLQLAGRPWLLDQAIATLPK